MQKLTGGHATDLKVPHGVLMGRNIIQFLELIPVSKSVYMGLSAVLDDAPSYTEGPLGNVRLLTRLHWFHNSALFQFNRKWFSYCRVSAETQQWSPWEQWWWTDWLFTDSHWPVSSEVPPIWRHCQQQGQMERAVCAWYETPPVNFLYLQMLCTVHTFLPMNIKGRWFFITCPVSQIFLCVYCAQSSPIRSKRKWSQMSSQTSKPMFHPLTKSLMGTSLTNHRSQMALLQREHTTSVQTTCLQITWPGMVQTWHRVHPKSLTLHTNTITGIFSLRLIPFHWRCEERHKLHYLMSQNMIMVSFEDWKHFIRLNV